METKSRSTAKHVIEVLCYIILVVALCIPLQRLVKPKYMSFPYEGAMLDEYYRVNTTHDVIFLGDCEIYESVSPVTMWEEYGISSYVRGTPQQLIFQSYYILKDTLKEEKPKVVVFNAMEMKIGQTQSEAYTRLTLDDLKHIQLRLAAAKVSKKGDDDSLISYAIPLLRYHSRWSDLNSDDFEYFAKEKDWVSYNGYQMQLGVKPMTEETEKTPLVDYSLPDTCWEYLDKIRELCEENDIQFVMVKAPTDSWQYPWYDEWEEQIDEYAAKHQVLYINGNEFTEDMGLDMTTDSYDAGVHLNIYGAEKFSRYLANVLVNECHVEDRRGDKELAKAWEDVCNRYHSDKNTGNIK